MQFKILKKIRKRLQCQKKYAKIGKRIIFKLKLKIKF